MTSSFAKDFEKIAPALDDIAPQRKVQVEAVAAMPLRSAAVTSARPARSTCWCSSTRLVWSTASKEPDVIGNRITMKMVHRDGSWLVDDIRAV